MEFVNGFKLGFCPSQKLKSSRKNKTSATQHASVIDAYLRMRFLWAGQQARSIPSPPNLQISRLGVTPKKGQPRKWHLNVDLSSPAGGGEGASVNDGLARISLLFITLLLIKIVHFIVSLGERGSHG